MDTFPPSTYIIAISGVREYRYNSIHRFLKKPDFALENLNTVARV